MFCANNIPARSYVSHIRLKLQEYYVTNNRKTEKGDKNV